MGCWNVWRKSCQKVSGSLKKQTSSTLMGALAPSLDLRPMTRSHLKRLVKDCFAWFTRVSSVDDLLKHKFRPQVPFDNCQVWCRLSIGLGMVSESKHGVHAPYSHHCGLADVRRHFGKIHATFLTSCARKKFNSSEITTPDTDLEGAREWLTHREIRCLDSPSQSPDLNISGPSW